MRILGISAFYHDSAAALVVDGRIVAAAQEERFTRRRHDARFPANAIAYCLGAGEAALKDVDYVVFYDKPFLKFDRLLETYIAFAPKGLRSFRMAMPLWLREKLFQKSVLRRELADLYGEFDWKKRLLFCEHHFSHAASAFYPAPFQEAAVLTMDGVGEWATTSTGMGSGNRLEIQRGAAIPALVGAAVFGVYLLYRLQGQFRRIQAHGPCPLRRAEIRQAHSRADNRPQARRLVLARSVVLQLLHRLDHDQ